MKQRSVLRNRLEFLAYSLALQLSRVGSPVLHDRLGSALGRLFHRVARSRRSILEFNLELAYPDLSSVERHRLALEIARHFGRALLASLRLQRCTPTGLRGAVDLEGLEFLQQAAASGEGFFILSAHLGAWEVAALRSGLEIPTGLAIVHRPLDNPLLDRKLEVLRALHGNRVLGKRGATRGIMAEIRAGGAVGILIDQRASGKGAIEVPFFGHPARTHTTLARIVLKTGAAVLPVWAFGEAGGRFSMQIEEAVRAEAGEDVGELTARFAAVTERAVRRRPEQWLWYHDRWREIRLSRLSSS